MLILTLRTDKPDAEIGLFDGSRQIAYETWTAHRELAETIHLKITAILKENGRHLNDLQAVGCHAGPGSFTGLRIGLTTANALAYALEIPIAAQSGEEWLPKVIDRLERGDSDKLAMPEYGADVNITKPKK